MGIVTGAYNLEIKDLQANVAVINKKIGIA